MRPNCYLDIKLVAFSQFPSNGNRQQWAAFYLESFLLISGISGFSFLSESIFENPETTENFYKLIFRDIKTIYLTWSTFLSILCDQDLTVKVLLKVIKENLRFKLEDSFLLLKPKLYLDNKEIAF